jgi:hypothetical protein
MPILTPFHQIYQLHPAPHISLDVYPVRVGFIPVFPDQKSAIVDPCS